MKRVLFKISTTIMAIVVVLSTMSFTIEKHFCGDFLIDISFVGQANKCSVNSNATAIVKKKSCCKDEIHQIEGQDKLHTDTSNKLTFDQQKIITAFVFSFQVFFEELELEKEFYKNFPPPELNRNIQILYQTFLI